MTRPRSLAREFALQAIYQWQLAGHDAAEIERQFSAREEFAAADLALFRELLQGVMAQHADLDARLRPCLDRSLESVDPVERALLRLGAFELAHCPQVPYRVILNEAIELGKRYGATDGHKYINGVLDRLGRDLRPQEYATAKAGRTGPKG